MRAAKVTVRINQHKLNQKVGQVLDDHTRLKIQEAFAETIDPWTPFLTGRLSGDITIDPEGVTYNVPYAKAKYFGEVFHKEAHPLASSHWDKVAMEQGAADVLREKVKAIITERVNELYG